jgi:hypothetical protein
MSRASTKYSGNNGSSESTSTSSASPSALERARHKPEVERKHRTHSEDMTELRDPESSAPLELVSAAPRRIDDNMNVVVASAKGLIRSIAVMCANPKALETEIANAILKARGYSLRPERQCSHNSFPPEHLS